MNRRGESFKEKFFLAKWNNDADHHRLPLDKNELPPCKRAKRTLDILVNNVLYSYWKGDDHGGYQAAA